MTYAYLLAGEDMELAEAELEGFLRSQGIEEEVERKDRLALTDVEPGQLKRLALVHEIVEVIERGEIKDLDQIETDYSPETSFAIRAKCIDSSHDKRDFEEKLGEIFSTRDNRVDLENPDETIRLYLFENKFVIGKVVENIDRSLFEKRKNQERPFSSPVSLDPVTARTMVNLAEVPAGEHVLDPFCGTGGVLIEAGLCGIGVHGMDISQEMVSGTIRNLEEYGIIVHDIRQAEVSDLKDNFKDDFNAIITDLPYGKASRVENNPVDDFLAQMEETADKAVFMYDEPEIGDYRADFDIYVHSDLTRYIYVVEF